MTDLELPPVLLALAGSMLLLASWRDLRYHRIDNWITFPFACLAIALHAFLFGWQGAYLATIGLVLGLLLLLPFYIYGGMAAGDVKLMAAVGAMVGLHSIFWTVMYSLLVGALMALTLLIAKHELVPGLRHMCRQIWAFSQTRVWVPAGSVALKESKVMSQRFPYAAAITGGFLVMQFCGSPQGI